LIQRKKAHSSDSSDGEEIKSDNEEKNNKEKDPLREIFNIDMK